MKILVVKRDKIGDLLLTTPLFAHLRQAIPEVRVHVLANDYNAWVVAGNPDIERVWMYPRTRHGGRVRLGAAVVQLRQLVALARERFDVAIAAGGEESARAIRRALAVRAARTIAYATEPARYGRRLTDALPIPAAGHEVERMLAQLSPLGVAPPSLPPPPRFEFPSRWRDAAAAWLASVGMAPNRYVVIGIGAREVEKQPTADQVLRWAARLERDWGLATALQYTPGDAANPLYPGSEALARGIAQRAGPALQLIPEGLPLAVGLVGLARTSVLPDGGLMHLAALSLGGVVGLFARPTALASPARWGPRGPRAAVLCAAQSVAEFDDATVFAALTDRLR
jgi:ADP-heptose:LPS heptosyltransferase